MIVNINGEYVFDIYIPTMFHNYHITVKNHNMVVDDGIYFFLMKAITPLPTDEENFHNKYGIIGYIGVGTGTSETDRNMTSLESPSNIIKYKSSNVTLGDNQIIISCETSGGVLDNTTEIGVYTTTDKLISRDVHDPYYIPSTAIIGLTYTYTLTNIITENEEEDE